MRPWRLARRQRVEMEAALGRLRRRVHTWPLTDHAVDGMALLGVDGWATLNRYSYFDDRWLRIIRARVALALRAALRADEDARCEEARARCLEADAEWLDSEIAIHAMREWPGSEVALSRAIERQGALKADIRGARTELRDLVAALSLDDGPRAKAIQHARKVLAEWWMP